MQADILIEKIKSLPPERVAEVEAFVESLAQHSGRLAEPASADSAADEATKAEVVRRVAESMKANSFTGNPSRLTRENLHDRR